MNNGSTIVLTRTFSHPPERVFDAFSTAEAIARWLSPSDEIHMSVQGFDFMVEGSYKYLFRVPNQGELELTGRFLEIDRPTRLSFSWCWQEPDPHAGIDSHVLVEFFEVPEGTRLSLTHTKLDGVGMNKRHDAGWNGSLRRLETHLLIHLRK